MKLGWDLSLRRERGSACVELSLLAVVLVPMLLCAIALLELGWARIKAQEAARFLAWELAAARPSSVARGRETDLLEQAARVRAEALLRYGDDLDGSSGSGARGRRLLAIELMPSLPDIGLESEEAVPLEAPDPLAGPVAGDESLRRMLEASGLEQGGLARARFAMESRSVLSARAPFLEWTGAPLDELLLEGEHALLLDDWSLPSGAPVNGEIEGANCRSDYCRTVSRMAFIGVDRRMPWFEDRVRDLARDVNLRLPLVAVVASLPLSGGGVDASVRLDVARPPGHSPVAKHFTNVFKDWLDPSRSVYHRVYRRLGPFYLGCRAAERKEGECPY